MVITCGNCGITVEANQISAPVAGVLFLWCPSCHDGSVKTIGGVVFPIAPAAGMVKGLPEDVERSWQETRRSYSVGAYTACEMMCRKILMHIAVDKADAAEGSTFSGYVDALERSGWITPGLSGAAAQIKNRGNAANHELPASNEADTRTTMYITEYLLKGMYELPPLIVTT